jgi:2,4-dienoyl-CoA reductase-like NADH-dependent reductase (Old Yellow Enzyme family)
MNSKTMAFYEAMAGGDSGLLIVESTKINYPTGGRGKQRYRFNDDKYAIEMREPFKRFNQNFL